MFWFSFCWIVECTGSRWETMGTALLLVAVLISGTASTSKRSIDEFNKGEYNNTRLAFDGQSRSQPTSEAQFPMRVHDQDRLLCPRPEEEPLPTDQQIIQLSDPPLRRKRPTDHFSKLR